jgi:RNA polymerase sigma-70 factor (ECF subfamily)
MTTALWQSTFESALTLPWVRTFCAWLAANIVNPQPAKPATADERRIRADVAASLRGEGAAYARIIERFQSTIAGRMNRFTRDRNAIEELTHDVFVEAYFSLPGYEGDAPLEHWLQKIATRIGYGYWKRKGKNKAALYDEAVHDRSSGEATGNAVDDQEEVAQVLEQLPPRDRLVLTLLYLESRSVAEAADVAGWSQTMVKVQAYRARQKFEKLYRKMNAGASRE